LPNLWQGSGVTPDSGKLSFARVQAENYQQLPASKR
jgi:hypothetical protein